MFRQHQREVDSKAIAWAEEAGLSLESCTNTERGTILRIIKQVLKIEDDIITDEFVQSKLLSALRNEEGYNN